MSARSLLSLSAILVLGLAAPRCFSAPPGKPKLVVGIVIDQFRYDYLTRFRSDYHGGFDQLLSKGANFTNAFYGQIPTVTAVGHSIFMSGAMPSVSGIVGNSWYDRDEAKMVTSVCDWDVKTIGGHPDQQEANCTDSDPASPKRLLVSTIGDELRIAHENSKIIGISIKPRGAILPSGHRAAGAYWFDDSTGNFVSSSFYMEQLPGWAAEFNQQKLADKYIDQKWEGFPNWNFHGAPASKAPYAKLPASPWGNELIERFAESAIRGEKLGQRDATDLLTVSFSSNDYVGHAVGPDAPEVRDMAIRTDQLLAKLFRLIDSQIGLQNVVIALSADHGVAATPAQDMATKMPGNYVFADVEDAVVSALNQRFGKANWLIPGAGETVLYFNREALANAKQSDGKPVDEALIYRIAKQTLLTTPQLHVCRVYTREQLDSGIAGDFIAQAATNGYFPRRSGDLVLIYEPGFLFGSSGTSHFSPYNYDSHVPVIFMGKGIKGGRYDERIQPNDIAPTLATLLDIQTPSGSSGRVLSQIFARE
jgi:predicted AlkP superfamily pyrophosphatase or phosphodiesterase